MSCRHWQIYVICSADDIGSDEAVSFHLITLADLMHNAIIPRFSLQLTRTLIENYYHYTDDVHTINYLCFVFIPHLQNR
jgi:hypothetical protein